MFIESINAPHVTFLEKSSTTKDARFPGVSTSTVSVAKIKEHPFFAGIFQWRKKGRSADFWPEIIWGLR